MQGKTIILALATSTTALIAGVYFSFSVAINPAFSQLSDRAYIEAMQRINSAIVNPLFALCFFGAPVLLPVAAGLYWRAGGGRFYLLAIAAVVFLIGSLGVTVVANIPLNEKLAAFPIQQALATQAAAARADFSASWNRWHNVRTVASVAAMGLAIAACLVADPAQSSDR
ncbi:DUF1772 domain-containing protein [Hymenobacter negativus]|uniref:DUF1772 domain-containing protein n=1 Tax=Hymenobacter negativus TaxID=2795026 RepID=A0ABS3QN95_9BACT|nr:anthrone oxygenase family protein [Hymenobacter negativus]MBO2012750.1 DUF1772 domain-containing protein [Hymenobacter negativus]